MITLATHYFYLGIFMIGIIIIIEPPKTTRDWLSIIPCLIVWPFAAFWFILEVKDLNR